MSSKEGVPADESDTLLYGSSYSAYVLQLAEDGLDEEELAALRQHAIDLGLSIKDYCEESKKSLEAVSETSTETTLTPTTAMSASQITTPSSVSSSAQRMSSSAHSISSLATCPPAYNKDGETRHKLLLFRAAPSRHSFDASYYQDHRVTTGFRQSIISKFPYFKKRSSVPAALPSKSRQSLNTSQIFQSDYNVETRIDAAPSSEAPSPAHLETPDPEEPIDMDSVARSLSCSILTTLREMHENQKRRHLEFKKEVLNSIQTKHDKLIEEKRKQNEEGEYALEAQAIRIEERDLVAEISLAAELRREKQALQTSIRHMEAYFNTPPPSLPFDKNGFYANLQPREFTDQKRSRLSQSYHELNTLDALHESKIKVLRDRQARNFQETLRAMELESLELAKKNKEVLDDLENRRRDETMAVVTWLDERKRKLIYRWALEEGIARRRLEDETKQTYGPLPRISFNEDEYDGLRYDRPREN
ncbi:hypothetical protein MauCBS54593_000192 [Microsporum audouinii]